MRYSHSRISVALALIQLSQAELRMGQCFWVGVLLAVLPFKQRVKAFLSSASRSDCAADLPAGNIAITLRKEEAEFFGRS